MFDRTIQTAFIVITKLRLSRWCSRWSLLCSSRNCMLRVFHVTSQWWTAICENAPCVRPADRATISVQRRITRADWTRRSSLSVVAIWVAVITPARCVVTMFRFFWRSTDGIWQQIASLSTIMPRLRRKGTIVASATVSQLGRSCCFKWKIQFLRPSPSICEGNYWYSNLDRGQFQACKYARNGQAHAGASDGLPLEIRCLTSYGWGGKSFGVASWTKLIMIINIS